VPLAGADDGDPVAALRQAVNKPAERHGDAVDFGGVGFGYEDKVQSLLARAAATCRPSSTGNDATVM
jgi:hypothetical protein